jgi:hypothetical protein
MAVSFLNLVDDDGSNTVGSLVDKAELQLLLRGSMVTSTSTGAVNNWAPPIDGHTYINWNGAADATFSGLAGGLSGLTATVKNITTTKIASFLHQSGLSSAGNKFTNYATSGATSIAPSGSLTFRYDGTDWQLIAHEQGDWITVAFNAANFGASGAQTWTLTSPDVAGLAYWLRGRQLTVTFSLDTTSVGGTPSTALHILQAAYGGFTGGSTQYSGVMTLASDNGTLVDAYVQANASATVLRILKKTLANWTAAANTTTAYGTIIMGVT